MKSTIQPTMLNTTLASPMLDEDAIRVRAYELYAERGMVEGHAVDDWLKAKADLLGVSLQLQKFERKVKAHTWIA